MQQSERTISKNYYLYDKIIQHIGIIVWRNSTRFFLYSCFSLRIPTFIVRVCMCFTENFTTITISCSLAVDKCNTLIIISSYKCLCNVTTTRNNIKFGMVAPILSILSAVQVSILNSLPVDNIPTLQLP